MMMGKTDRQIDREADLYARLRACGMSPANATHVVRVTMLKKVRPAAKNVLTVEREGANV